MKLKAVLVVLFLAVFAVACDQEAPTAPDDTVAVPADGPLFARPTCPGHPSCKDGEDPKQKPYEFEYDFTDDSDGSSIALGSNCVLKLPGSGEIGYGRTFWCSGPTPTFKLKVVDTSTGLGVVDGFVVWVRCEHVDGYPVDWTKCGVRQRSERKSYQNVYFGIDETPADGVFQVILTNWSAGESVWGMRWLYWDDGKKPDIETKFKDLACVGYRNAFEGPQTPCD